MWKWAITIWFAAVVAAGCGQATANTIRTSTAETNSTTALASGLHSSTAISVTGGTASQRAAIKNILAGLGTGNQITRVAIAARGPRGFEDAAKNWITVTIPGGTGPSAVIGNWQAELLAGSLRDISASSPRLPHIGGLILTTGGARVIGGGDHPAITATHPITNTITTHLSKIGLTPMSINYLHPDTGIAPVVIAKITDPETFRASHTTLASAIFEGLNAYEGTYIEVENQAGKPVEISTYASRAASGSGWARSGYATVSMHG